MSKKNELESSEPRYDFALWQFCQTLTWANKASLSKEIKVYYGSLRNWWSGKRHGRKRPPTLSETSYNKVLAWAKQLGFSQNQ